MASKSIVPSIEEQTNIFSGLVDQMMQQGQLIGVPQIPGQVNVETGTTLPAAPAKKAEVPGGNAISKETAPAAPVKQMKTTDQSVTANIANQGQLIPIAPPVATSSSNDDIGDLKKLLGQIAGKTENPAASQQQSGGGGGGIGDIIGTVADVALSFIGWIICTELVRQGKMPRKWWVKGARIFAVYPNFVKQGYYLWARSCVVHLRRYPNSWFSRFLCIVFNARARSIAERTTFQGTLVTVILWPICWTLGAVMWLCNIQLDGLSVYREAK